MSYYKYSWINLRFLLLSNNKIEELQPGTFGNNLSELHNLDLDNNQIQQLLCS